MILIVRTTFSILIMLLIHGCVPYMVVKGKIYNECSKDSGSVVIKSVNVDGFLYDNSDISRAGLAPLIKDNASYVEYNFNTIEYNRTRLINFKNRKNQFIRVTKVLKNNPNCNKNNLSESKRPIELVFNSSGKTYLQSRYLHDEQCFMFEDTHIPKSKYKWSHKNIYLKDDKEISISKSEYFITNIKTNEIIAFYRNYHIADHSCRLSCFDSGVLSSSCSDKDIFKEKFNPWMNALIFTKTNSTENEEINKFWLK